jgi:hypothetical protein
MAIPAMKRRGIYLRAETWMLIPKTSMFHEKNGHSMRDEWEKGTW